jgi:hypothetical protein
MARAEANSSQAKEKLARWRPEDPAFAHWAESYGVIRHSDLTQARIHGTEIHLAERKIQANGAPFYDLLHALDRLASAAMWLVVHETYARNVYLDGHALSAEAFEIFILTRSAMTAKIRALNGETSPQGHHHSRAWLKLESSTYLCCV